jgi:hypothetical protein
MTEGMAINLLIGAMDETMVEPMLDLLEDQIRLMNPTLSKDGPASKAKPVKAKAPKRAATKKPAAKDQPA